MVYLTSMAIMNGARSAAQIKGVVRAGLPNVLRVSLVFLVTVSDTRAIQLKGALRTCELMFGGLELMQ